MKKLFLFLIVGIFIINCVYAYEFKCLGYGMAVPDLTNPRYTCYHDICPICVDGNNYPVHINKCDSSKACNNVIPNPNDHSPPILNINSPNSGAFYSNSKVLINLSSNEPAVIYLINNNKISKIASMALSYSKEQNFKEGFNNITLKAYDKNGLVSEYPINFFVDSKKPQIINFKIVNKSEFNIEFKEENPKSLQYIYGNYLIGFRTYVLIK